MIQECQGAATGNIGAAIQPTQEVFMSTQQTGGRNLSRARFLGGAAAGAVGLIMAHLEAPDAARAEALPSPFPLNPGSIIPAAATTAAYLGVSGFEVIAGYPEARLALLGPNGPLGPTIGMEHPRSSSASGFTGTDTQTIELPSGASASRSLSVAVAPGSRTVTGSMSIVAGSDRLDATLVFDMLDRPGGMQPAYRLRDGKVRSQGRSARIRAVDRPFVIAATGPDDTDDLHQALQAFDQAGRQAAAGAVLASPLYRLLAQIHADPLLLLAEAFAISGPSLAEPRPWAFPTSLDCMLGKTIEQTVPSVLLHHLSCMGTTASQGIDQSSVAGFGAAWPS